ncbi:hypothetical protein [Olene mendosa nucleopolyhedrovirus]|uniref:RING-type domain-containing protein n=1 Tax=Olene mendosa nucleopolyhedrovirus TaxID=2933796 RepID=A0AAX3AV13_9ABAC|nr:hypothetical protein QKV28_gp118 [Olene mendosa nucleopolyhedrovirus]UOQ18901.1 hypothetical protein [Olene mendosa nucleopolyhedrovirus]
MECYICFETTSALRTVVPGCGHAVCCNCYSKLTSCPTCRRQFSPRRPAPEAAAFRHAAPTTFRQAARRSTEHCSRDDFKHFVVDMFLFFFN